MLLNNRLARFRETDLYVVITERFCAGRTALAVLGEVLAAGVGVVQLREKEIDDRELFERARAFRERTLRAGALLIVDDRVDVALAADADGVHLGQRDLPVREARGQAPSLLIGASSHTPEQAWEAQAAGASYVNIGPIYPTQTKATGLPALGPAALDSTVPRLTIPFTVMGGIKAHNLGALLERGARHVAVVTAVTAAGDVAGAARALRQAIGKRRTS
ncbi:MAG TPA: thiamine phosphate synthase [Candidatus Methanoperedens sp.]|nr:thiamine phosphate synthase [Candidatus Methanoperedens sp.]